MVTDVRIARFTGAYQPYTAPDTDRYHLIQSYLAIGVGGITGEGLGQSVQKLGYLMEAHTDFIMAIIAEELGFIGVIIVIDRKSTRLNSSHVAISYAVFCLKKRRKNAA